jgi:deoxyribonuclease V
LNMRIQWLHDWQINNAEARQIQEELAGNVSQKNQLHSPAFIAGTDISVPSGGGAARASIVVLKYPELELVEVESVEEKLNFPYIPGLLSFREAPLIIAVCQKLTTEPDLLFVDGQGIAHPRRLGLASHLGLFLDIPTIGCAKSRLCGQHDEVSPEAGSYTHLIDNGEIIGAVVRSSSNVRPLYISVGHKIDLPTAIKWSLSCCRGYRIPEPTRLAHIAAGGDMRKLEAAAHYSSAKRNKALI